ncbi:MAG: hypothetical protein IJ444_02210 [Kiritimatiellae bacterium]|nr:hypothetical protein [Kiritimatiellia bacterium]
MSALEQIMWERDVAIKQLEEHGIPFGGLQQPMTFEEFSNPDLYTAVWMERVSFHSRCTSPVLRFHIFDTPYMGLCGTVEPMTLDRYHLENYGKTWRCWAFKPTVEEMEKARWAECQ